jgi:hypothetical protein
MSLFAIVVVVVAALGCAFAAMLWIWFPDPFRRVLGRFWLFHGEPDAGPHLIEGARDEDRHVIDPQAEEGRPPVGRRTPASA